MSDAFDVKNSLNGSVNSQGIPLDVKDWLDIGSEGWKHSTDEMKAKAYQAAKVCGWTDAGLRSLIIKEYGPRIDDDTADFILEVLQDLAKQYPVEIEQVYEVKEEVPVIRRKDQ